MSASQDDIASALLSGGLGDEEDYSGGSPLLAALSGVGGGGLSPSMQAHADNFIKQYEDGGAEMRKAHANLMDKYAGDKEILRTGRAKLQARQAGNADLWLAISAGLGAPTRSGAFGESIGNVSANVLGTLPDRDKRNAQIAQYGLDINGIDENMAKSQFDLMKLEREQQARMAAAALRALSKGTSGGGHPLVREMAVPGRPGFTQMVTIDPVTRELQVVPGSQSQQKLSATDAAFWNMVHGGGGGGAAAASNPGTAAPDAAAEPTVDPTVKAMANYEMPPLTARQLTGLAGRTTQGDLLKVNPDYDAKNYDIFKKGRQNWLNGPDGKQVQALGTAVNHMSELESMVPALENSDFMTFNALANRLGIETGNKAITDFKTGQVILGKEIEKYLVQNGGTGPEREEAKNLANTNYSPEAIRSALKVAKKFLAGQLDPMIQRATGGERGKPGGGTYWTPEQFQQKLLRPETLKAMREAGSAFALPAMDRKPLASFAR